MKYLNTTSSAVLLFLALFSGCAVPGTVLEPGKVYKVTQMSQTEGPYITYAYLVDEKHYKVLRDFSNNDAQAVSKLLNDTSLPLHSGYVSRGQIRTYWEENGVHYDGALDLRKSDTIEVSDGKIVAVEPYIEKNEPEKKGWIDYGGKQKLAPLYGQSRKFFDNSFLVWKGKYQGIISADGNVLLPFEYEWISDFSEGMAVVCLDGKRGFINEKFETVIEPKYERARQFVDGVAPVRENGRWYLIGPSGKRTFEGDVEKIGEIKFADVVPVVIDSEKDNSWNFIDATGRIRPYKGSSYSRDNNQDYLKIETEKGWLLVDRNGNVALPYTFPYIQAVDKEHFIVRNKGMYGLVNKAMKPLIPFEYSDIFAYTEFYQIEKRQNGKKILGMMDRAYKMLLEPEYKTIESVGEGYFKLIPHRAKGEPEKYFIYRLSWDKPEETRDFSKVYGNNMIVREGEKEGLVGIKDGKTIFPFLYKRILDIRGEYLIVQNDQNKVGVVNLKNETVIPADYNYISFPKQRDDLVFVTQRGKKGIFGLDGDEVLPLVFKTLYEQEGGILVYSCFDGETCF